MQSSLIPVLIFHNDILSVYGTSISYTGSAQHSSFVLLSAYNKKMRDQKNFLIIIIIIYYSFLCYSKQRPDIADCCTKLSQGSTIHHRIAGKLSQRFQGLLLVVAWGFTTFTPLSNDSSTPVNEDHPTQALNCLTSVEFQSGPTVTPEGKWRNKWLRKL